VVGLEQTSRGKAPAGKDTGPMVITAAFAAEADSPAVCRSRRRYPRWRWPSRRNLLRARPGDGIGDRQGSRSGVLPL